jgi:hypothetical protein
MISFRKNFLTTVIIENQILPNSWEVQINLVPNTDSKIIDIDTATDRINVWIDSILDNSMLVGPNEMKMLSELTSPFEIGVHPVPDQPYDRMVAMCLYTKFTSIIEKKLFIDSIWLESYQADGLSHTYAADVDSDLDILRQITEPGNEEYAEYWYRRDPVFFRVNSEGCKLYEQTWSELGMGFDIEQKIDNVVRLNQFKPRIVPGDKNDDNS